MEFTYIKQWKQYLQIWKVDNYWYVLIDICRYIVKLEITIFVTTSNKC